jgi:branched-chain amino acid transport system ATP-binding protein
MLAIGRALMSEPRLLLLDEPSLGLAPLVISTVYEAISRIAAEGVSILLVEQNTEVAFDVAHRGYVLSHGQVVASGLSESFRGQSILQEAFFGQEARGAA